MWYAIIGTLFAAFLGSLIYISFRAAHFTFIRKISRGSQKTAHLISFAGLICLTAVLGLILNLMNALVCIVHLVLFWMICDIAASLITRICHVKLSGSRVGTAALIFCGIYLAAGWYAAHHVRTVFYGLETEKLDGRVRIVQVTDAHLGATFHADRFLDYMEEVNSAEPDAVVVTGDFVDDDTSREDMLGACDALGKLRTKYGVFFVYGNHDKGYMSDERRRWGDEELRTRLKENGVILLEDSAALIDGRFYIAGRRDRSDDQRGEPRKTAEQMILDLDRSKYIILLDHQPFDFDAEAEAGADLVLCGHTHGGQFIPINHVGEWIGENCLSYGHEKRLGTDFIVSSGISNWTFRFKTGCRSEYVVIDVEGTGNSGFSDRQSERISAAAD